MNEIQSFFFALRGPRYENVENVSEMYPRLLTKLVRTLPFGLSLSLTLLCLLARVCQVGM